MEEEKYSRSSSKWLVIFQKPFTGSIYSTRRVMGGGVRVKGTRDCVLLHFINYPFINYPFINYPFLGMLNLAEYFFDFAKTFLSNFWKTDSRVSVTGPNKKFDYLIIAFIKIQYVLNCILIITDFAVKLGNFMFSPGAYWSSVCTKNFIFKYSEKTLEYFWTWTTRNTVL